MEVSKSRTGRTKNKNRPLHNKINVAFLKRSLKGHHLLATVPVSPANKNADFIVFKPKLAETCTTHENNFNTLSLDT